MPYAFYRRPFDNDSADYMSFPEQSICSHTIHKPPGSVLNIPDMANDWRFRGFPSVKAGLRSYAGVPLTHEPQSDEDK